MAVGAQGSTLVVTGLDELRDALLKAQNTTKPLTVAHRKVAKIVEPAARARALSGTRQQAKMVGGIKAAANAKAALIRIRNTKRHPYVVGSIMGAKRFRQFPTWVGNQYQAGGAAVGRGSPPVIGTAVDDKRDEVRDTFVKEVLALFDDLEVT